MFVNNIPLAAGALVMILGGLMLRLLGVAADKNFGLYLIGLFIAGVVLASIFLRRKYK